VPILFSGITWVSFQRQHPLLPLAAKVTSVALGFLNFIFIAALASWLVLGISRLADWPLLPPTIATTLVSIAVVCGLLASVNATRFKTTFFTVRLSGLPSSWHGQSVALVSDMHLGLIRGPNYAKMIVERLHDFNPVAVLISGDMFDGSKIDLKASVAPWRDFRPPRGIYFVTGNHEHFSPVKPYFDALEAVGIRVLHNEKLDLDGLQLIGIHDSATSSRASYEQTLLRTQIDPQRPSLLLCHRPVHLEVPASAGISFQLAGHTHAGQFFPWTWFVRASYGRFACGLNSFRTLQVLTSSGAGTGGPPMRLGTQNEIVIIRLEGPKEPPRPTYGNSSTSVA